MPKPLLIGFDGIDGSGKGTAVRLLAERLVAAGLSVWCGTPRDLVGSCRLIDQRDGSGGAVDFNRRFGELIKIFRNSLYDVVIFDRSVVTLWANQVYWKHLFTPEEFWSMSQEMGLYCDLQIILDPGIDVCRERVSKSASAASHLAKTDGYLEDFASTMTDTMAFLQPQLGNRLVTFADNMRAVEWVADMVFRLRTHFDLHLTNACPLKCEGCAFGAGAGYVMPAEVLKNIFRIIDAGFNIGITEFHLLGGEPLVLGRRLVEIMRYIRQKGGSMHLLTSAYDLTYADEVLDLLAPDGAVFVSLDGPREVHNARRGMDIFDNVIEFLRRAMVRGVKIRIGTVVDRINIDRAAEVVDVLEASGIIPSSLCFMNMSPTGGEFSGGQSDPWPNYIPAAEWVTFVDGLVNDPALVSRPWVKVEPAFSNRPELFGCELHQGKRRVVVMSDGAMYDCFMLSALPPVANILDGNPQEQLLKLLTFQVAKQDACGNGCWGGCPGYAKLFGNGICDARCPHAAGSQIPTHIRVPPDLWSQGYRPICPCRAVRLKDLI